MGENDIGELIDSAQNGDPDSLYRLGMMYYNGDGVDRSFGDAAEYFDEAAKKNHARAIRMLGIMYREGQGVARSQSRADRLSALADSIENKSGTHQR